VLTRDQLFWIVMTVIGLGLILLVVNDSTDSGLGFSSDSAGSMLYLSVWGFVLAAGLLASRRRMGDLVRGLGMWVLIILALVAGYQYRYELQDFANRISAGLIPGSPLTVDDGGNSVMLERLGNGHFGARGAVNGAPVDFLVDTGASNTVLTFADAKAAGFDTASLDFSIPVQTANGMTRAAAVTTDSITIGSITRSGLRIFVSGDGALDMSLLGLNFLDTLSGYDVRGDRMILRD
jgi:aspartyl protease family protein